MRANLREGMRLLREAGYEVRDYKQVNSRTGEALSVEMLSLTSDPSGGERVIHFYKPALARLGIDVTVIWTLVLSILGYQLFSKSSIVKAAVVVLAPLALIVVIGTLLALR